jgi:uncharacterized protein (DUF1697 family)
MDEQKKRARLRLVLLRGINVGGNNIIKMEALKKTFEELGCTGVKTYIQSGNIIFHADETDNAALTQKIEQALSKKFHYAARLALLDFGEMKKVIADMPAGFGETPDTFRCDVWFLLAGASPQDIMRQVKIREGVDQVYRGRKAVYAARLNSQAGKSFLTKIIREPVYQYITIRGFRTTLKLFDLMRGDEPRGETGGLSSGGYSE